MLGDKLDPVIGTKIIHADTIVIIVIIVTIVIIVIIVGIDPNTM